MVRAGVGRHRAPLDAELLEDLRVDEEQGGGGDGEPGHHRHLLLLFLGERGIGARQVRAGERDVPRLLQHVDAGDLAADGVAPLVLHRGPVAHVEQLLDAQDQQIREHATDRRPLEGGGGAVEEATLVRR